MDSPTPPNNVTDQPKPDVSGQTDPPLPPSDQKPPTGNRFRGVYTGRLNRLGYFMVSVYWSLLLLALIVVATVVTMYGKNNAAVTNIGIGIYVLCFVLIAVTYFFTIGALIRRLHDMNQSGWLAILVLVPFVNSILSIIVLFVPGTPGPNVYGEPYAKTLSFHDVNGL